jgi:hypothetical protein
MNNCKSELDQIETEVKFWREFVQYWEKKHCKPVHERIAQMLNNAEDRYKEFTGVLIKH